MPRPFSLTLWYKHRIPLKVPIVGSLVFGANISSDGQSRRNTSVLQHLDVNIS
jgi:hypothetical protein